MIIDKKPFIFNGILIPKNIQDQIIDYVENGIHPDGFVKALLTNNLIVSFESIYEKNLYFLPAIIRYLQTVVPYEAWGSIKKYEHWLEQRQPTIHEQIEMAFERITDSGNGWD